jgi:hypothetical protein
MRISDLNKTKNINESIKIKKIAKKSSLNERHQLNEFVPVAVAAAASALGISAEVLISSLGLATATALAVDIQQDPEKYSNLGKAVMGASGLLATTLLQQYASAPEEVDDAIISGAQAAREADQAEQIDFLKSIGIPEDSIDTNISAYSPYQGMTAAERETRLMQDMARDAEFNSDSERRNFEIDMAAALDNTKRELQRSIEKKLEADGVTLDRETRENIRSFINSGTAEELLSGINPSEIQLSRSSEAAAISKAVGSFVSGLEVNDITAPARSTPVDGVRPEAPAAGMPAARSTPVDGVRPEAPAAGMPELIPVAPADTSSAPKLTATQRNAISAMPAGAADVRTRPEAPAAGMPADTTDNDINIAPTDQEVQGTGNDVNIGPLPDVTPGAGRTGPVTGAPAPAAGPTTVTPPLTPPVTAPGTGLGGLGGAIASGALNALNAVRNKAGEIATAATATGTLSGPSGGTATKPKPGKKTDIKSNLLRLKDPLDLRRNIDTWKA